MKPERITDVLGEATRAQDCYGDFTSTHEALGVLVEEMAELTEAIRSNKLWAVEKESKQVAAVALRLYSQLMDRKPAVIKRSSLEE